MKRFRFFYLENVRCRAPREYSTEARSEDDAFEVCEGAVGTLFPDYVILNVQQDGVFLH